MGIKGPKTVALRRYLSLTPEQRADLRETYATMAAERYEQAQAFARRFLEDPRALTPEERKAGAYAFERWRVYLRDQEWIEDAMRTPEQATVIPFRPRRPALFVVPDPEPDDYRPQA